MESIGIRDRIVIQHCAGEQSNRRTIPIEFVILVIASRAGAKIGEVVHEFDGRDPLHIEPALADSDSGNNALLRRQPMAQQNAIVRWGEGCLDRVVNGMGGGSDVLAQIGSSAPRYGSVAAGPSRSAQSAGIGIFSDGVAPT